MIITITVTESIGLPLAVSAGILLVLAGHFQWTGCWFAVSLSEVHWKSPTSSRNLPENYSPCKTEKSLSWLPKAQWSPAGVCSKKQWQHKGLIFLHEYTYNCVPTVSNTPMSSKKCLSHPTISVRFDRGKLSEVI